MKPAAAILLAAVWSFALADSMGGSTAARADEQREAVSLIKSDLDRLLSLQDSAASGNLEAAAQQKLILPRLTNALKTAADSTLPNLIDESIAYVLSGGDPALAERVSKAAGVSGERQNLLKAVAAFMGGNRDSAAQLFERIEPIGLPARLVGRVALAKALLTKAEERQRYFRIAMASMPGTLVEESALRRSTLAYAEAYEERNMWKVLDRYVRRFPSSVYAGDFWKQMAIALCAWPAESPLPSFERLDGITAKLPLDQRRSIYLSLARAAAAKGLPDLTSFAGSRLSTLSAEGTDDEQLGRFYANLFEIVTEDGDTALRQLRGIRAEALGVQEKSLLNAAMSLGLQIESPPEGKLVGTNEPEEKGITEKRGAELLAQSYQLVADSN